MKPASSKVRLESTTEPACADVTVAAATLVTILTFCGAVSDSTAHVASNASSLGLADVSYAIARSEKLVVSAGAVKL